MSRSRVLLPYTAAALSLLALSGGCATAGASTEAVALSDAGAAALAEGSLDEAEARLRLALEYRPDLAEAHANLGLVALARGDLEAAATLLRRALRHDEDSEEAWQSLGVVRLRRGDEDGAAQAFEAALAIDPGLVGARRNLADLWLRRGRYGEARAQLFRVLALAAPESEDARRSGALLAWCELRLDRPAAAKARADAVLAASPGDPFGRLVRGVLRADAGDYAGARADLRVAEAHAETAPLARLRLAAVLVAEGRLDDAGPRVRVLLRRRGDEPAVRLVAGWYALATGDAAAAGAHAAAALRLAPELEAARVLAERAAAE